MAISVALSAVDESVKVVVAAVTKVERRAAVGDGRVTGSRCVVKIVEPGPQHASMPASSRIENRSAGRIRSIIEDCVAVPNHRLGLHRG